MGLTWFNMYIYMIIYIYIVHYQFQDLKAGCQRVVDPLLRLQRSCLQGMQGLRGAANWGRTWLMWLGIHGKPMEYSNNQ